MLKNVFIQRQMFSYKNNGATETRKLEKYTNTWIQSESLITA